ncbi:hypothetical protein CEXT_777091 [Caerostris extrusa]|uniref:Uncharacterized protein n=1 Tax=Caerostris extrusa TaxID=172846 RepID=A0AAV4V585_CAEEX|nr:hypothetical protein CEXT_777091 [Caerostris extrusa]
MSDLSSDGNFTLKDEKNNKIFADIEHLSITESAELFIQYATTFENHTYVCVVSCVWHINVEISWYKGHKTKCTLPLTLLHSESQGFLTGPASQTDRPPSLHGKVKARPLSKGDNTRPTSHGYSYANKSQTIPEEFLPRMRNKDKKR